MEQNSAGNAGLSKEQIPARNVASKSKQVGKFAPFAERHYRLIRQAAIPDGAKNAPSVGSIITFGDYDWRVLDVKNGKALLIAQDITHVNMPYNEEWVDVTWETCTLRKWLNEEFYNSFSAEEQRQIVPTAVTNDKNQWYGTDGGKTTQDRIFLLSIAEVVKYFGDSGDLRNERRNDSDGELDDNGYYLDDEYNNERIAFYGGESAWWWLRSPGGLSSSAAFVFLDGRVFVTGSSVKFATDLANVGVRPALWLNL